MNIPRGLDRVARVGGALALTTLTACAASLEAGARGRAGAPVAPDGPDAESEPAVPAQVVLTRTGVVAIRCEETDAGRACEALVGRQDRIEIGTGQTAQSPAPAPEASRARRDTGDDDDDGREVQVAAGIGFVNPTGNDDGNAVAVEFSTGVSVFENPDNQPWYKKLFGRLRARFARAPEVLTSRDATIRHNAPTQVLDAGLSLQPHLIPGGALRFDLGAGVGIGHVDERQFGPDMSVDGETTVTGSLGGGVTATGDNFGVRVGADCTFAGQEALQTCGGSVQAVVKF